MTKMTDNIIKELEKIKKELEMLIEVINNRYSKFFIKDIDELELTIRTRNCLENMDIKYIGELVKLSRSQLLAAPNLGRKSLNEIEERLDEMGLFLGMDVPQNKK